LRIVFVGHSSQKPRNLYNNLEPFVRSIQRHQFWRFERLTTAKNSAIPLILNQRDWDESITESKKHLEIAGLKDRGDILPVKLSGGEQGVVIVHAIISSPESLILDEPTASLNGDAGRIDISSIARPTAVRYGNGVEQDARDDFFRDGRGQQIIHPGRALHAGIGLPDLSVKAVCPLPGQRQSGLRVWSDEEGKSFFTFFARQGTCLA
jgi:hypothetical protein